MSECALNDYDADFLQQALRLAEDNARSLAGGPFGAVVVKDGRVIASGTNRVVTGCDPTAHAEVVAIRAAAQHLQHWQLSGCTLYTSCEPCPMCLAAAWWSRVDRIVYAGSKQDAADIGFDDGRFYEELARDPAQRTIPMQRLLADEGRRVLLDWNSISGKTSY